MQGFTAANISYKQTNAFATIVNDYVEGAAALAPFYEHPANIAGIEAAIKNRKQYPTNRKLLVDYLKQQYSGLTTGTKLQENIDQLLDENCFTITTAHQPNIFTGHLYFVYKILHVVKLAASLKQQLPQYNFVPVYYMGSEDADLEELGTVSIDGKKYNWHTNQTGAVGRMKIDKAFMQIIDGIEAQLVVEPFGTEMLEMLKRAYSLGKTIEQATLEFVHELFGSFGLIILLPDHPMLKAAFEDITARELQEQFSSKAVQQTVEAFPEKYKVQAAGREINLFYLKDDQRERIEFENGEWVVLNSSTRFNKEQLLEELHHFPERFSANVILRPVFQELVLPNIAFIGGGGELAYWLELKEVFKAAAVPYPVLLLRKSFMFVDAKTAETIVKLGLQPVDFFRSADELLTELVQKSSDLQLQLTEEKKQLGDLYQAIGKVAGAINGNLQNHTMALLTGANKKLENLEKKMLRAEKKKFEAQQRQVAAVKHAVFPNGNLQERVDNLLPFYARYGAGFINTIYQYSLGLEQEFCIITEG